MSDAGAAAKAFRFDSSDPSRDRARFFLELRAFGQTCGWSQPIENEIALIQRVQGGLEADTENRIENHAG